MRHYGYAHYRCRGRGAGVPRRRFSEDKARIASEAMIPGATVAEVGRRYGVCGSLISR